MRHLRQNLAAFSLLMTLVAPSSLALASDSSKQRHKVIDFEDEVVEGVNKRPLDSLSQISDAEKRRRKSHLYRKRTGFKSETAETLTSMRYIP